MALPTRPGAPHRLTGRENRRLERPLPVLGRASLAPDALTAAELP